MDAEAIALCRKFDTDNDGYISKEELEQAAGKILNKKEIEAFLKNADTNKDGKIDYQGKEMFIVLLKFVFLVIEFFKAAFAKTYM